MAWENRVKKISASARKENTPHNSRRLSPIPPTSGSDTCLFIAGLLLPVLAEVGISHLV